jgi:hypothetical protein
MAVDESILRMNALAKLAVRRQAAVGRETLKTYIADEALSLVPLRLFERVCDEIGRSERQEGEPAMPSLGTILGRCRTIQRHEQNEAESRRLLAPPAGEFVSAEKLAEFKAKVRAAVERRRMR